MNWDDTILFDENQTPSYWLHLFLHPSFWIDWTLSSYPCQVGLFQQTGPGRLVLLGNVAVGITDNSLTLGNQGN